MKKLPLTNKEFSWIYKRVTRLCVEGIITTRDGVLLSKRAIAPSKGLWHFTGGTVRFGETLEQAVKRIAKEETGFETKIIRHLGFIEQYNKKYTFGWPVSVCFLLKPTGGRLHGDWQTSELRFFKKRPKPIVKEQADFLMEHKLIA